jgi:hypothetical protein
MPIAQKAPKGPRPLGDSRGRTRAARMVLRRPRQTSPATNWRWLTTPPATATTGLFRTARYAARLGRPPAIANENEQTFRPWYPQFPSQLSFPVELEAGASSPGLAVSYRGEDESGPSGQLRGLQR